MACTNPRFLIPTGYVSNRKTDGAGYMQTFYSKTSLVPVDFMRLSAKGHCIDFKNLLDNGFITDSKGNALSGDSGESCFIRSLYQVPCGHCDSCLANRSRDWCVRLNKELQSHPVAIFVTLTYSNENYPGHLVKSDLQKFFKRLRKLTPVRYFACGEYGDTFGRGHYHAIIFSVDPSLSRVGLSSLVRKSWQLGFVNIGEANPRSVSYTCRYVLKKIGSNDFSKPFPMFQLMSTKPPLGGSVLIFDMGNIYPNDKVWLDDRFVKPPRFCDKKIASIDPDKWANVADKRRLNALAIQGQQLFALGLKNDEAGRLRLNEIQDVQLKKRLDILKKSRKINK